MVTPVGRTRNVAIALDREMRLADPEWFRDRDFLPAYKFTKRTFVDNRNNVYQPDEEE